jgi:hypothetical protein
VYSNDSILTVKNSRITTNTSNLGGGVYTTSSTTTISQLVLANNYASYDGGGMYVYDSTTQLTNSIVAYNIVPSDKLALYAEVGSLGLYYTNIYGSWIYPPTIEIVSLSDEEPGFQAYDIEGVPTNYHLAVTSFLVNAGDPNMVDVDGSRSDLGSYGGSNGDDFDLDHDNYPDYFWPGTITEPPTGFEAADYDSNDADFNVH